MKLYSIVIWSTLWFLQGCSGCSRSGRRASVASSPVTEPERVSTYGGKTTVKMKKVHGVYQIPVEIDDVPMSFIFDTGAGMISISTTEATFLYRQGKLSEEDIVGKAEFTDASGNIIDGTVVILHSIRIGNRFIYNVQAAVSNNIEAPLLLGQSAMEKFGKISIDNLRKEITFE